MLKPLIRYSFPIPVFNRNGISTGKSVWTESIYYYWWEYLRRNEGYLKACTEYDYISYPILSMFGDVRVDDFKSWWFTAKRGMELFAEPVEWNTMKSIPPYSKDPYLYERGMLLIKVPLHLPQSYLKKTFNKLIKEHHHGRKGRRYGGLSKAKFKVIGQPRVKTLSTILKVYDLKNSDEKLTHYQIAMKLGLVKKDHFLKDNDPLHTTIAKKRIMASTVSRYLLKANRLIENVAYGKFPDYSLHSKRKLNTTVD